MSEILSRDERGTDGAGGGARGTGVKTKMGQSEALNISSTDVNFFAEFLSN